MRIIAGLAKGSRLFTPTGEQIRPTLDRVREAIFSLLYSHLPAPLTGVVSDLYAGPGALGLEALSRGATKAYFVDRHIEAQTLIAKNLEKIRQTSRGTIITQALPEALTLLPKQQQLLLADPPYDISEQELDHLLHRIDQEQLLATDGLLVLQTSKRMRVQPAYGKLSLYIEKTYGKTGVRLYRLQPQPESETRHA